VTGLKSKPMASLLDTMKKPKAFVGNESTWNLNLDQIESDTGRVIEKRFVSPTELGPSTHHFETGTVLYSKLRPYLNKVVVADESGFATTELVPLRCDTRIAFPEYLAHYLRSNDFVRFATNVVAGAKMPRMIMSEFWRHDVPLPPLPEQRRIAAILDQADVLRAKRREALAQLDSLTQSIFIEMFGDPATNPKGWKECSVGDVADCIVPGRDKPKSFTGATPWVTTDDLSHLAFTNGSPKEMGLAAVEIEEVRARVIPAGSVIISCVGNLGITTIAGCEMVINQQLHSFQCHAPINNVYLMHALALQKAFMYSRASSTTLPYMNKTVCNSIPVLLPPIEEQKAFAELFLVISELKTKHQESITQLNALFAALQYRAFRGEL